MQMLFTAWLMEAAPIQSVAGGSPSRALWESLPATPLGWLVADTCSSACA